MKKCRSADKPGSVATNRRRWPFLWDRNCLRPQAIYPRVGRYEPHRGQASLTFPLFDLASSGVYLAKPVTRLAGGLLLHRFTLTRQSLVGRFTFCGTVPSLTTGRCYRPLCSAKPGLSSVRACLTATTWPTNMILKLRSPHLRQDDCSHQSYQLSQRGAGVHRQVALAAKVTWAPRCTACVCPVAEDWIPACHAATILPARLP